MRALIASQAFGSIRRRGPRCSARKASALDACWAWFMIVLAGLMCRIPSLGCRTRTVKPARSGGQVKRLALAGLMLSLVLGPAIGAWSANEPGTAGGGELARLAEALAATEAAEGPTSPYLLPLIEEDGRVWLRGGGWARGA